MLEVELVLAIGKWCARSETVLGPDTGAGAGVGVGSGAGVGAGAEAAAEAGGTGTGTGAGTAAASIMIGSALAVRSSAATPSTSAGLLSTSAISEKKPAKSSESSIL